MPYFSENIDCEIHVTPGEFLDKCSRKELENLYDELEGYQSFQNRFMDRDDEDFDTPRSYGCQIFYQHLKALKRSWYQVSKEDAQLIESIAKKYGSV